MSALPTCLRLPQGPEKARPLGGVLDGTGTLGPGSDEGV